MNECVEDMSLPPEWYLDWLIEARTCDWCGESHHEPLVAAWLCRHEQHPGYESKHWKYWKVCGPCRLGIGRWKSFALPFIRNVMPNLSMADLIAVQPMQQPAGQIPYMDYVIDVNGARPARELDVRGAQFADAAPDVQPVEQPERVWVLKNRYGPVGERLMADVKKDVEAIIHKDMEDAVTCAIQVVHAAPVVAEPMKLKAHWDLE